MGGCAEPGACRPEEGTSCTGVGTQYADVSLHVRVQPYALLGEVKAACCGEPAVTVRQACGGCEITITQPVCIRIPVEYGAGAEAGELTVRCRCAPDGGCGLRREPASYGPCTAIKRFE